MSVAFRQLVEIHREDLHKRAGNTGSVIGAMRRARSAESLPPVGQGAEWYGDVLRNVRCGKSGSAWAVARQLARLCGDDSEVTMPRRSIVDAVQDADTLGRDTAFVERGRDVLVDLGWLEVETVGRGRGARTTWRLMPGACADDWMAALRWSPEGWEAVA